MNKNFRSSPATAKWLISRALFAPLLAAMLYCGSVVMARGQTNYQRLKSFGFPELSGSDPRSPLVKGSDGKFYGTTFAGTTEDAGTVFTLNSDGSGYVVLRHFTGAGGDGSGPVALVEGSDGVLYGTTEHGGTGFCSGGTIFRLNKNGSGYAVLRSFDGCGDAIAHPPLSVVQGSDGALYGTTSTGGVPGSTNSIGAVFRLNKDGSGYLVLHLFTNSNDGSDPVALIQGSDGALYGTAWSGGSNNSGTIFRLNRDGSAFTVLHSYSGGDSDGSDPRAGLLEASDNALYGTTIGGGTNDHGTIFKLNKDGSGYIILHSLWLVDDGRPRAALIEGCEGTLYGSTWGYKYHGGRLFKLEKDGNGYTVLYSFPTRGESVVGVQPNGLVEGNDGALYGTTINGGASDEGSVFKLNKDGNGYRVLHNFNSAGGDGVAPVATLLEGSDGALYGTTSGDLFNLGSGEGTVFKMRKDGNGYMTLHSFSGDFWRPEGELIEGSDRALYGTTFYGGSAGVGTVFKLNKDGTAYSVLHSFGEEGGGKFPHGGLIRASDDALYGTTRTGGTNRAGTVFMLNQDGSGYRVLHSFSSTDGDGASPIALMEGSDGTLYGTKYHGGNNDAGLVFKLNKDASGYSVLRRFSANGIDGQYPFAALLEGSDGTFYGTTSGGGGTNNAGTVFKLNKDGNAYSVLHRFSRSGGDGLGPMAGLVEWSDGTLYGTTAGGGSNGAGTIFKVNKDGSGYTVLRSFGNSSGDGLYPQAGLVKGDDGALYGTTEYGGDLRFGTVFKLFSSTPIVAISPLELDGAGARLSFSGGASGQTFRIETKTDLNAQLWQTIATNQFGIDGRFQFHDTSASNFRTRFYRSATP